jgi:RNA polymerase sigma-70 factor (ECF subfamily)
MDLERNPVALEDRTEEWVRQAGDGDEYAFRCLFERYAPGILRFAFVWVGNREAAEDLTQETFARAYLKLKALRNPSKFSTWLFGIARNVAREAARSRRHEASAISLESIEAQSIRDQHSSPEGCALDHELQKRIRSALLGLDEDKRVVFAMKVILQKSYAEISEITGFSIPKLKTDLHRARVEMRRKIAPYVDDSDEL